MPRMFAFAMPKSASIQTVLPAEEQIVLKWNPGAIVRDGILNVLMISDWHTLMQLALSVSEQDRQKKQTCPFEIWKNAQGSRWDVSNLSVAFPMDNAAPASRFQEFPLRSRGTSVGESIDFYSTDLAN